MEKFSQLNSKNNLQINELCSLIRHSVGNWHDNGRFATFCAADTNYFSNAKTYLTLLNCSVELIFTLLPVNYNIIFLAKYL